MVAVLVVGMAVCVCVASAAFCLGGPLAVWPLGGVPRAYPPTCGGLRMMLNHGRPGSLCDFDDVKSEPS